MISKLRKALWDFVVLLLCYLSVTGAGITLQMTKITGGVFQTEASLVSLCHLTACADLQQIIMAELIHAVVVPAKKEECFIKKETIKSALCGLKCSFKHEKRMESALFTS